MGIDLHQCPNSDTLFVRYSEDVALAPVDYLQKAGVMDTFDATRRSGIGKIVETIQVFAREHSLAR